jgi:butyrate kinase
VSLFLEGRVDDLVEVLGGGEVGAEGFLDDDARPAAVLGFVEAGVFQVDEDFIEELGRGGDVEQAVALAAVLGIDGVEFSARLR